MKNLFKYLKGYRAVFTLAIFSIVIATAMQLATPILTKYAVDSVIGNEPAGNLQFLIFSEKLNFLIFLL